MKKYAFALTLLLSTTLVGCTGSGSNEATAQTPESRYTDMITTVYSPEISREELADSLDNPSEEALDELEEEIQPVLAFYHTENLTEREQDAITLLLANSIVSLPTAENDALDSLLTSMGDIKTQTNEDTTTLIIHDQHIPLIQEENTTWLIQGEPFLQESLTSANQTPEYYVQMYLDPNGLHELTAQQQQHSGDNEHTLPTDPPQGTQ